MMDAASDDPIEMIATLARGMMAERRGRFLDAACGGDANLRAEVEARLGDVPKHDGTDEQPAGALADRSRIRSSIPSNPSLWRHSQKSQARTRASRRRAKSMSRKTFRSAPTATRSNWTHLPGCGFFRKFVGPSTRTIGAA